MAQPKRLEQLELIAGSSGTVPGIYSFATHLPLASVLEPGYFDRLTEGTLRKSDVVRVVARYFDDEPEVMWLRVASVGDTIVMVKEFA